MKKVKKELLKVVERVTRNTVEEWPPFCVGLFHQPKRPVGKKRK